MDECSEKVTHKCARATPHEGGPHVCLCGYGWGLYGPEWHFNLPPGVVERFLDEAAPKSKEYLPRETVERLIAEVIYANRHRFVPGGEGAAANVARECRIALDNAQRILDEVQHEDEGDRASEESFRALLRHARAMYWGKR